MAARIGADMRGLGVHQGLAPVLDVVRDARWGRVEETIGEDPYLIGTVASAYIRGLESEGVVATLKHFVGYSASKAGRNLAPVSVGRRELADVLLPPFEMAVRESGVRSVMNAYTDIDGVPTAADGSLLTELLRDTWGFDGTVVADYFAIGFLHLLHGVAGDWTDAAAQALEAGIDVELPTVKTFSAEVRRRDRGRPRRRVARRPGAAPGAASEGRVRHARRRLLPRAGCPRSVVTSARGAELRGSVDLDSAENREIARALAEQAVVLLRNDGLLPLGAASAAPKRIAVIGPNADDPYAVLGCYSFPAHVGVKHPEVPIGIELPTLLESLRAEFPASTRALRSRHHGRRRRDGSDSRCRRRGSRCRRRRARARRPRRPVRPRHERRGLRRREPRASRARSRRCSTPCSTSAPRLS